MDLQVKIWIFSDKGQNFNNKGDIKNLKTKEKIKFKCLIVI